MIEEKKIIALDCDGVLLSYNESWGKIYEEYYKIKLEVKEPSAYHAYTYWGVDNPEWGCGFYDLFNKKGWRNMPALKQTRKFATPKSGCAKIKKILL